MTYFTKSLHATLFALMATIHCTTVSAQPAQSTNSYVSGELFVKISKLLSTPTQPTNIDGKSNSDKYYPYLLQAIGQFSAISDIKSIEKAFPLLQNNADLQRIYRVSFSNIAVTDLFIRHLQASPIIEYVERVPLYNTHYTPNDLQSNQWHLSKIAAQTAWDIHIGTNNVVVAIVDDGVLTTHEDLAANIVAGFDVADNDANPSPPAGASGNCFSHGTHCAGIVAAVNDNNTGIASLGGHVRIMPIKTKPNSDLGNNCNSLSNTIAGIEYAIAHNVDVISMSFGGYAGSNAIQELFNQAQAQGIVCVAAAGNDNTNDPSYPAAYEGVISVAASNENDQKANFSNYGTTIDVAAPGTSIYSTLASNNSAYGTKQGTSMACPLVASLCALMLSYQPNLSPAELETCLKSACDNINTANPTLIGQLGAGRINAQQALACLQPEPTAQFSHSPLQPCAGQSVQFQDNTVGTAVSSRLWTFEGGTPATSTLANPSVIFTANGAHNVTLNVSNSAGTNSISQVINVQQATALLSGNVTIVAGNSAVLNLALSGTPPFEISYTDGTTPVTISGITTNSYPINVSPANTSTYSLVSVSGAGNCAGTVSGNATVTVIDPNSGGTPIVNIAPIPAVCKHDAPFSLSATPIGGVFSGNGITNATNGIFNPSIAGLGNHTIVYTYNAPDGNTYSSTATVVVNGENVYAGNDRFICPGESIQLQATGGSNYTWSPNDYMEQGNSATPIVYPPISTVYTVVSTDANGCQSSDAVKIALNPAPYFPVGNIDTVICGQNSASIRFTDTEAIGNYSYNWFPSTGIADPDVPNSLVNVEQSTFYSLIIANENGCQAVRNFTVWLQNPDAHIQPTEAVLCHESVQLTAIGNDIVQYAWSVAGNTDSTLSVTTAATYTVTLTDSKGCADSASVNIAQGTSITPRINNTLIAPNANYTLIGTSEDYVHYEWSNGSQAAQISVGVGDYSVTVSDENGCSGTASATVRRFDQYAVALPTAFSPNNDGINDEWQIIMPDNVSTVQYVVYDRWGQPVFDTNENNVPIWNGKKRGIPCEQGLYVVVGNVVFNDGNSELIKSPLTLLR